MKTLLIAIKCIVNVIYKKLKRLRRLHGTWYYINKSDQCWWKCQNLNKCPDVSGLCPSSVECSLWVAPRFQVLNLKFESCVLHARELQIKWKSALRPRACLESKDETHLLPFPLFVPFAEFNPTDQCVVCGMSVRTEMLCDGKTMRILVNASEMLTKTFPQSAPSLADVNGRAATAGDAVNQTRGQTSEGVCNRYVILWPQKIGFVGNVATSTATWVLTWISTCACCSLLLCRVN